MSVTIEVLRESNLESLIRLKEQFLWNQTENDIRRILRLNRGGNFAAFDGEKMVGSITTALYGRELAWIGMMMVDREYRRRGIARSLMTKALEYLSGLGVDNVRLDATPEGFPLYDTMGFIPESTIERWECSAQTDLQGEVHRFERSLLPSILELDRLAFGADRSMILLSLLEDTHPSVQPLVSISPSTNSLDGYALARKGSNACYIGPVVAQTTKSALSLLMGILGQLKNQRAYIDFNKNFSIPSGYFPLHGFVHQRNLTRMSLNGKANKASPGLMFAIAGPELG